MLLIPAIDLKDGKCVRLRQGRMEDETVFSDNPVAMAGHWVEAGAKRIHLVDLNGAFEGKPVNGGVVHAIAEHYPDIIIQIGGGVRDEAVVEDYLDAGVDYVIIGTKAVTDPDFVAGLAQKYPGHIIVGLDAKDGKIATEGWANVTELDVIDYAKKLEQDGIAAIIYTDIARDGMMTGVNVDATVKLAEALSIPVIASGGITNIDDVRNLCEVSDSGIVGAITGRAIYEGTLDFAEAQTLIEAHCEV